MLPLLVVSAGSVTVIGAERSALAAAPTSTASPGPTVRGRNSKGTVRRPLARPSKKRKVFLERRVPWLKGNQPNVQSLGALVVDLDDGEELYARTPDQARPIASISKLAALLVVVEKGLL